MPIKRFARVVAEYFISKKLMIMAASCFYVSKLLLVSMLLLPLDILLAHSYSPKLCDVGDKSALLQFKASFVIDKFASSDPLAYPKVLSWTLHSDCCSWDGVYCDDEGGGHVIGLDLSSSCLFGSISSNNTLFKLNHLQRLSLADNNFNYSPIPPELALLSTTLTHLNLSKSNFAGQIPPEISSLSKLAVLDLSSNVDSSSTSLLQLKMPNFTSLVQYLTNLEDLDLSWVNISSAVPSTLSSISSLSKLSLRSCNLVGEFPSSIFLFSNVQYLNIRYNQQLTGHLPQLNWSPLKSLKLSDTGFSGELPDSIRNLHFLTELNISMCKFSGPIPSSFGNLTKLTSLDFSYNNFTVGDLSWLAHLTNLETLSFKGVNISSDIPSSLASLTNLKFLCLQACRLTGTIPFGFQNLTQLTTLDLGRNLLQGPLSETIFSKLVNLELICLYANNFTGMLDFGMFHEMRNLTVLDLGDNHMSILDYYGTLPNLSVLSLASSNLRKFPSFLREFKNLSWLSLANNNIDGEVPSWLCNTSKETLLTLDLSNNSLTGLGQCSASLSWVNLQYLELSRNSLRGPLPTPPTSIIYYIVGDNRFNGEIPLIFCNLDSLVILDLSYNNLSGKLPYCLGNLTNLSVISLSNNSFYGNIPQMCTNGASRLEGMDLSENQLQGEIPRSLANCSMLRGIDVGKNQINDTFPFWMGKLQGLQLLILRSNRFHGAVESSDSANNTEFPNLRIIDLSRNRFSGLLPSALFYKWKAMKKSNSIHFTYMQTNRSFSIVYAETIAYNAFSLILANKGSELEYGKIPNEFAAIDFSSNDFYGEIPESIGNLNGLYVLNLSNNYLTGHIAPSLANLSEIESLDFSNNKLSGEIPQELAQLNFLAFLNVSRNNLDGQVPRGKQFDTFLDDSFEGNLALCGDLLITKRCKGFATPSPTAICSENCEDVESSFPGKWNRIVITIGYASGLVVGIFIGNTLMKKKPQWFINVLGKKMKPKARRSQRNSIPKARRSQRNSIPSISHPNSDGVSKISDPSTSRDCAVRDANFWVTSEATDEKIIQSFEANKEARNMAKLISKH